MDPMKSFNEIKSRLQKTLYQTQNQPLYFSSILTQSQTKIHEPFHKNELTAHKYMHQVNQLKTSQKPTIRFGSQIQTQNYQCQSWGQSTPKSMSYGEQTRLNMSNLPQANSQKYINQESMKKQKDSHAKCKQEISRLKISETQQKIQIQKCQAQIQKHQCEKVEYEEIVFQLKRNNDILANEVSFLKRQLKQLGLKQDKKQQNYRIQSQVVNFKYFNIIKLQNSLGLQTNTLTVNDTQNDAQKLQIVQKIQKNQSVTNIQDLQRILAQMKKKLSVYEKQLAQKQMMNNHQHYLLQRLKNQHSQLNSNQSSLLQELQYVLTKSKKLKIQNEQIRAQNEDRTRQVILLQEINSKLETDVKDLIFKIDEVEREKVKLQEKLQENTMATKQPQSSMHIDNNNNDELLSPLKLHQHLQRVESQVVELEDFLIKIDKPTKFSIVTCFQLQILSQSKKEQNSLENNVFSKSVELDDTYFFNQLDVQQLHIVQLQQELALSKKTEEQFQLQMHKVKVKLQHVLRDLHVLQVEHDSMKKLHEEQRQHFENQLNQKEHLLIVALSLVEQLKRRQLHERQIRNNN